MTPNDIDLGEHCRRAGRAEAKLLGAITADAFRNDPFNLWLFGNFAGISNLFHLQARSIYAPRGYCYTAGEDGACMWMLPGGDASFSTWDYVRFALPTAVLCGPGAVKRGIKTGEAMAARHPKFEHAYLFSIGVVSSAQGKGLGRTLIQPVLDACDNKSLPAYLENSNPDNTGFYISCGFAQMGEPIVVEPNAPPLVPMVREPRRS
jgi:GNAT superfamily N-acetyltransferase